MIRCCTVHSYRELLETNVYVISVCLSLPVELIHILWCWMVFTILCLGLGLATSRSRSRIQNVSSRTKCPTSWSRLGSRLGLKGLVHIPGNSLGYRLSFVECLSVLATLGAPLMQYCSRDCAFSAIEMRCLHNIVLYNFFSFGWNHWNWVITDTRHENTKVWKKN